YQAAQRGAALRDALQSGSDVTRATLDAGFGSPSRMYDSASAELGMAPSAFRRKGAGLTVRYASASTSLGFVLVAATDKGICKIGFGDDAAILVDELRGEFANADLVEDAARLAPFIAQIDAYLRGSRQNFDLPLDIAATAFRQRVWDALRRIPYGETRSYSQIAEAVGAPHAVRAVASACATNPVALAIPCHRVVQKGGALAGYRWGLPRKAALLDNEAQHADDVSPDERDRHKRAASTATTTKLDHAA
ncbi:MAG: AraC family transcriptional regulator, partial [Paraburkholderia sp.]|nr:AraC family transcriptional regulator [Paraburkholderia sp.]